MERRDTLRFLGGLASLSVVPMSAIAQTVMRDCGDPNGEVCRLEDAIRRRRAEAIRKWEETLSREAGRIHAKFKEFYPKAFFAKKGTDKVKISRTIIFGTSEGFLLNVLVFPLPDVNGAAAKTATVDIWRKRGWGGTKNIALNVSRLDNYSAPPGRSVRIGKFRTHCVVLYSKEYISPKNRVP